MDTSTRTSGYQSDKTIQEIADSWAKGLKENATEAITRMDDGEDVDFDCYGIEKLTTIEVTIAGGGPGADVAFEFGSGGDFRQATLRYYEMGGRAEVILSDRLAENLMMLWGIDYLDWNGPSGW